MLILYSGVFLLPTDNSYRGQLRKNFPLRTNVNARISQRKMRMANARAKAEHIPDITFYNDRKLNVSLPRLPFDNYPLTPRKNKNCSFVNNQKAYLKLKGYQINDVYSLKRRRSESDVKKEEPKPSVDAADMKKYSTGSNIELPSIFLTEKSPREKKWQWQTIQEDVWRPQESRRLPNKNSILSPYSRNLDRELHVPGHVRSRDVSSLKLGKVLTQAKLRQLLTEEQTNIPRAFYT